MDKGPANTNCLRGIRCPNEDCHSTGPFQIEARATFEVTDYGTEQVCGSIQWESDSHIHCVMCSERGLVSEFEIDPVD